MFDIVMYILAILIVCLLLGERQPELVITTESTDLTEPVAPIEPMVTIQPTTPVESVATPSAVVIESVPMELTATELTSTIEQPEPMNRGTKYAAHTLTRPESSVFDCFEDELDEKFDLESLSYAELKAKAKRLKIPNYHKTKKEVLIQLILSA